MMRRYATTGVLAAATALLLGVMTHPLPADGSSPRATGKVVVVQAYPGASLDVVVDGRTVARRAGLKTVLAPLELSPGTHQLIFSGRGAPTVKTFVTVRAGSSNDVVLHRPASVSGKPVVNVYKTPAGATGPGKARVLVAHTATVAPADVAVDGTVVFRNIANGEFAAAELPAGPHQVSLLPAGSTGPPILGPLTLDLAPATATMVYAVGRPADGSMDVIAHETSLGSDRTSAPRRIDTGSAGLARDILVRTFR